MRSTITVLRSVAERASEWAAASSAACAAFLFLWLYVTEVLARYWHGPTAGRVPWHQYTDQSLYLASAQAFAALNFDPARHHYPPLYALVAAPFTWLFPADPFAFVNVLCVAGGTALLVTLFGDVIGRLPAALFAIAFLVLPGIMQDTFIVPWTSTLTTLLLFMGLWRLTRLEASRGVSATESFLFSAILGLVVSTRPLDAIAAAALYPFWLAGLWRTGAGQAAFVRLHRMAPHVVALVAGGVIGPTILFGANVLIYGHMASPYVRVFGGGDIFSWSSVSEKFVSIYLDSASLYVEPGQVILRRFPWMLAALFAILACLALGSLWLRAAAVAATLQLVLYLPFDDLLPNGLYRYFNYHYFRWAFWLAFMMLPAAVVLVRRRFGTHAWIIGVAAATAAVALACLQLWTTESIAPATTQAGRITVILPSERIDYIDLPGLSADWGKGYSPGQDIWLDARPVPFLLARFLQTATGTRLLFIRPVHGGIVELSAAQWRAVATSARIGSYDFTLGFPRWLLERPAALPFGVPLRLDGVISSLIFESGFASFDGRGRTIVGQEGVLALPLPPDAPRYQLDLRLAAAEPTTLALVVDGWASNGKVIEVRRGESNISIDIPPAAASQFAMTRVRVRRHDGAAVQQPARLVVIGVTLAH
jgi:hypothetical protein